MYNRICGSIVINMMKSDGPPWKSSKPDVCLKSGVGEGGVRGSPSSPTSCGEGCFFGVRVLPGKGDMELIGI